MRAIVLIKTALLRTSVKWVLGFLAFFVLEIQGTNTRIKSQQKYQKSIIKVDKNRKKSILSTGGYANDW